VTDLHDLPSRLLAWYAAHARALPWRVEVTPYRTWVSEIMLQQTRVETVIPYFERFMVRFPTVEALAEAPVEDLLGMWAGLGYYSRARNLHAAARQVVTLGGFPCTAQDLRGLRGVGPYTAAAIASIASGQDVAAVDGNVRRVVSRLAGLADGRVDDVAQRLVPPGQAGAFNQALMDLGATLCLPRNPACDRCPVSDGCAAHREGLEEAIPPPRKVQPPRPVRAVCAAWERDGVLLVVRNPTPGLLGGLWDLPGGLLEGAETVEDGTTRLLGERLGLHAAVTSTLGTVDHVFTHLCWHGTVVRVEASGAPKCAFYPEIRWVDPWGVRALPLSRLAEKVLAVLNARVDA